MKASPLIFLIPAIAALVVTAMRTPVSEPVSFTAAPDTTEMTLSLDAAGENLQLFEHGRPVVDRPFATVSELMVIGNQSDNTLTVDFSNGNPVPAGGLSWDGQLRGTDFDTLALEGAETASVSHTGRNPHDGSMLIAAADFKAAIDYTNLEPITDSMGAATREFGFLGGTEDVTVSNAAAAGSTNIASDRSEMVDFVNPTENLVIDTTVGTGPDQIIVAALDAGFDANLRCVTRERDIVQFNTAPIDLMSGNFEVFGLQNNRAAVVSVSVDLTTTGDIIFNDRVFPEGAPTLTGARIFMRGADFKIGGVNPGGGAGAHDQIDAAGEVYILGGELSVFARDGYVPRPGDVIVLINNDGAEAVNGVFGNFGQGAAVPNFLGSGLEATLDYNGGDGNDVVVTVTGTASPGAPGADATKPTVKYTGKNKLRNGRNTIKAKCSDNVGLNEITMKIPGVKPKTFKAGGATSKTAKVSFKTNKRKLKAKTTAIDTSGNKVVKKRTYKK